MIYQQQSHLPIIFQVDEGIILKVNGFLKRNKLSFNNVLVVSGNTFSRKIAEKIIKKNNWRGYILKNNTFSELEDLREFAEQENFDLIIGVGGGKVIDTVKRVSYLTNINLFSIPTIISNDGLISPIAVIKSESGKTESIPALMPMGVLIDLNIIKSSPIQFIRAAAGDILSNISATNDWILAFKEGKTNMNDIAFHLSRSAANSLIHFNGIDLKSKPFLRLVVQGQVNSGIAMALAGTSRPCSGSEHLISHAIDYLRLSNNLHGTQVASISLFTLFLQGKLEDKYIQYANETGIPLNFMKTLINPSKDLLEKILNTAYNMRPGRFTILNRMSIQELMKGFENFEKQLTQ